MKKFFMLVAIAFILIQPVFADKIVVAVSLQPYANIADAIGRGRVDVVTLLPPGADPHTFEPKPSTLKEFSKVSAYFSDGSGMDMAWMPRFIGVNKKAKLIKLNSGIQWMQESHEDHHGEAHHDEDRHELDPHVWTSPIQVMKIANAMCDAFISLDSAGKNFYVARLNRFYERLERLDKDLKKAVSKLPENRRSFIVYHPAYGYFARDYGMQQLAVEMNGKEPKPLDLMYLTKKGKEHNVRIVFVQPQFSKRSAQTIAKNLDAVVIETDPLSYDFIGNIHHLIDAITQAAQK